MRFFQCSLGTTNGKVAVIVSGAVVFGLIGRYFECRAEFARYASRFKTLSCQYKSAGRQRAMGSLVEPTYPMSFSVSRRCVVFCEAANSHRPSVAYASASPRMASSSQRRSAPV
jgi:hypothetical protein